MSGRIQRSIYRSLLRHAAQAQKTNQPIFLQAPLSPIAEFQRCAYVQDYRSHDSIQSIFPGAEVPKGVVTERLVDGSILKSAIQKIFRNVDSKRASEDDLFAALRMFTLQVCIGEYFR
jgi:hypothetical protein